MGAAWQVHAMCESAFRRLYFLLSLVPCLSLLSNVSLSFFLFDFYIVFLPFHFAFYSFFFRSLHTYSFFDVLIFLSIFSLYPLFSFFHFLYFLGLCSFHHIFSPPALSL